MHAEATQLSDEDYVTFDAFDPEILSMLSPAESAYLKRISHSNNDTRALPITCLGFRLQKLDSKPPRSDLSTLDENGLIAYIRKLKRRGIVNHARTPSIPGLKHRFFFGDPQIEFNKENVKSMNTAFSTVPQFSFSEKSQEIFQAHLKDLTSDSFHLKASQLPLRQHPNSAVEHRPKYLSRSFSIPAEYPYSKASTTEFAFESFDSLRTSVEPIASEKHVFNIRRPHIKHSEFHELGAEPSSSTIQNMKPEVISAPNSQKEKFFSNYEKFKKNNRSSSGSQKSQSSEEKIKYFTRQSIKDFDEHQKAARQAFLEKKIAEARKIEKKQRELKERLGDLKSETKIENDKFERHVNSLKKKLEEERRAKWSNEQKRRALLTKKHFKKVKGVGATNDISEKFSYQRELQKIRKASAIKIQSIVRGWIVRKHFKIIRAKAKEQFGSLKKFFTKYKQLMIDIQEYHDALTPRIEFKLVLIENFLIRREEYHRKLRGRFGYTKKIYRTPEVEEFFAFCDHYPNDLELKNALMRTSSEQNIHCFTKFTKNQILDAIFYIYVPRTTGLDPKKVRKSTWMAPIVNGVELKKFLRDPNYMKSQAPMEVSIEAVRRIMEESLT